MSNIQYKYNENSCELKIIVKSEDKDGLHNAPCKQVQNVRNCDLFIDEHCLLMYLDVQLYRFTHVRRFDMKDLKNIQINYNTKDRCMAISLPCLPICLEEQDALSEELPKENKAKHSEGLLYMKKITDQCYIRIDNAKKLLKPESNFSYGFASKFRDTIRTFECDLDIVTRMPEPNMCSPLQRTIDREIDIMKQFCRDQYKLNFVELQVPEGHDNPMLYSINFKDTSLSQTEQSLLHNLTCKRELMELPDEYDIMEIDCGLVNILLAICYDIRFTSNEANCESAWTRSILSATLYYFEPFTSLSEAVISFVKCSLTYPFYRNYELAKQCVEDSIMALQNCDWILKQLLVTRDLFEVNDRAVFNHYYMDHYIRYLSNPGLYNAEHLLMLSRNLKTVLLDVFKKQLGLGLEELETELLKELIEDMHISNSKNDCQESEDCESEEQTESEGETSISSLGRVLYRSEHSYQRL